MKKHKSRKHIKAPPKTLLKHRRRTKGISRYDKSPPGTASYHFEHFKKSTYKGQKVILYCRVSAGDQEDNLDGQELRLRRYLESFEVKIIGIFREVISGYVRNCGRLKTAAKEAKKTGAVILAESTDRFVRNIDYNSKTNPNAQPTVEEFEYIKYITKDVILATALHPDLPWKKVRKYQTIRGQKTKGGRHPKGWRKRRKKKFYKTVIRMRKEGQSLGHISKKLKLTKSLVQYWIAKRKNG